MGTLFMSGEVLTIVVCGDNPRAIKTCFALTPGAGLAFFAMAQTARTETFRITGIVIVEAGQPLAEALVEAYQNTGRVSSGAADIELLQHVQTAAHCVFEFVLPRVTWSFWRAKQTRHPLAGATPSTKQRLILEATRVNHTEHTCGGIGL